MARLARSTAWTMALFLGSALFLVGAASLSALPFVTAGFYSKDLILWHAWSSPIGSKVLWAAGLLGAFITSIYAFRMVFITFFGKSKMEVSSRPGARIAVPLIILAILSIIGGFLGFDNRSLFSDSIQGAFPGESHERAGASIEFVLQVIASAASLAGVFIAYVFFIIRPQFSESLSKNRVCSSLERFWFSGWGFDRLYDMLFVRQFIWLIQINRDDLIDLVYTGIAAITRIAHAVLSATHSGNIRW